MKFATCFLIVSFAVCFVCCDPPAHIWGDVTQYNFIGTDDVKTGYTPHGITMRAVKFPKKLSTKPTFIIRGIKHYDFGSHPSNVSIVSGGIGQRRVNLRVLSAPGYPINSLFHFYGEFIEDKTNN